MPELEGEQLVLNLVRPETGNFLVSDPIFGQLIRLIVGRLVRNKTD